MKLSIRILIMCIGMLFGALAGIIVAYNHLVACIILLFIGAIGACISITS